MVVQYFFMTSGDWWEEKTEKQVKVNISFLKGALGPLPMGTTVHNPH